MSIVKPSALLIRQAVEKPRYAIKLNCLNCSNMDTEEVRHCPVTKCALHSLRPYQPKLTKK